MKKTIKKKVKVKSAANHPERENYVRNRDDMQDLFRSSLKEVQRDKPSVSGIIGGLNYTQMAARIVFKSILDQEEYIAYTKEYKVPYVVLAEEKKILKDMIGEAKEVYGKQYDACYKQVAKEK